MQPAKHWRDLNEDQQTALRELASHEKADSITPTGSLRVHRDVLDSLAREQLVKYWPVRKHPSEYPDGGYSITTKGRDLFHLAVVDGLTTSPDERQLTKHEWGEILAGVREKNVEAIETLYFVCEAMRGTPQPLTFDEWSLVRALVGRLARGFDGDGSSMMDFAEIRWGGGFRVTAKKPAGEKRSRAIIEALRQRQLIVEVVSQTERRYRLNVERLVLLLAPDGVPPIVYVPFMPDTDGAEH